MIRHRPGLGLGVIAKAGDQVQMQMARPLTKGNRIHPIAARELPHQLAGLLHRRAPGGGLWGREVGRPAQVAPRIQQQPPQKRRRIGMVPQQPMLAAGNGVAVDRPILGLIAAGLIAAGMELTDAADHGDGVVTAAMN